MIVKIPFGRLLKKKVGPGDEASKSRAWELKK
jgi:hypothetical protein